ncbi:Beta-ketoadipate pathway transcriptional regulator, PcaR/PcaU/PobR family [Alloalcanivorax dieselolei B5]|uniref:Beta-ketoadipate pathway transcriptional regulator, PcaR/PcaU/PobR family n=1 Tax=Alcanivorax dieselolei (strain DSM 16502 / CGMCC 1.3690 / MCCC 1A00001 / B-5) TaxID=930169 RepID=K0CF49_ALCDB|nr:IclR family transcriptional regulator C-terminal domain-containing protein [Alloalcanivorax dieselolei]AFT72194.1 Beta-ketoadipate pathway transcriptional regulator, PcaR/PcaU/PobR family [Alloalcanivorax dieselolei B5]GGJ75989.1 IclR family transcriptional regulator [Alloalcanivorax dieselolei]
MSDNGVPRKDSYLQSLEKGLAVLECFSAGTVSLSISEIAERTGQDRASARRAILTLTHLGYTRLEGRRYSLTPKSLTLGHRYLSSLPFLPMAQRVIEELADELQETVSIGALDSSDVVFLCRVAPRRFLSVDANVGSRVPAHLHSMGQVLLAHLPAEERVRRVSDLDFHPFTPHSVTDPAVLDQQLEQVTQQGWAFTNQQYEEGYCGIAVALADASNHAVAALNVSFATGQDAYRRATDDVLPRLKLAVRRIQSPRV